MTPSPLVVEAIVLRQYPAKGSDRVLKLLTREHGVVSVFVRGLAKPGNRLGVALVPTVHITATLQPARTPSGLHTLVSPELVNGNQKLRQHLVWLTCAQHIVELVDVCLAEWEPQPELWELVTKGFAALPSVSDPLALVLVFHLQAVKVLGVAPDWTIRVPQHSAVQHLVFDPEAGIVKSVNQLPALPPAIEISESLRNLMENAARYRHRQPVRVDHACWHEISALLIAHAQYHLRWNPNSLKMLEKFISIE